MPESFASEILTLRIMYWNTGATHVGFELVNSLRKGISFQTGQEISEYYGHLPWIATFEIHDKNYDSLLENFKKLGYGTEEDFADKSSEGYWQYWGWQGWKTTLSRLSKPPFQLDQDKSPITETHSKNSLPIRRSYNPITNNCAHATLAMMQLCGVINDVPSRFSDGLFLPYRVMQLAEAARRRRSPLYKEFQELTPPHWRQHSLLPSQVDSPVTAESESEDDIGSSSSHKYESTWRDTGLFESRIDQDETSSFDTTCFQDFQETGSFCEELYCRDNEDSDRGKAPATDDFWEWYTWYRNQTLFGNHDTALEDDLLKRLDTFTYQSSQEHPINILMEHIKGLVGPSNTDTPINLDTQQRARIRYLYDLVFYFSYAPPFESHLCNESSSEEGSIDSVKTDSTEEEANEKYSLEGDPIVECLSAENPRIIYWNKILTPKITSTYDLLTIEDRETIAQALSRYFTADENTLSYCPTSQKLVKNQSNSIPPIYPWQNNLYLAAWLALATIAPLATAGACGTLSVHWLLSTNQAKALNDVMAMGHDHSETIQMASEDALLLLAGCLLAWAGYRILRKPDIASIGKLSFPLNPE